MANIFQFATSELSQDAFLCWLFASLGDKNNDVFKRTTDEQVYNVARYVLLKFLDLEDSPEKKVTIRWVQKQWQDLDVAVDVLIDNKLYVLGIEDKTRSYIHNSNGTNECQLDKYRKELLEFWEKEKSKNKRDFYAEPDQIKTIVYKTSFFSDEELQASRDWVFYDIEKITKIFKEIVLNIEDIHSDFLRDYLERLEFINNSFRDDASVYDWVVWKNRDYDVSWEQFYTKLNDSISGANLICEHWFWQGTYLIAYISKKGYKKSLPCIHIEPRGFEHKGERHVLFSIRLDYEEFIKRKEVYNLEYVKELQEAIKKTFKNSFKKNNTIIKYLNGEDRSDKGDKQHSVIGSINILLNDITKVDPKTGEKTISKEDLKVFMNDYLVKFYSAFVNIQSEKESAVYGK